MIKFFLFISCLIHLASSHGSIIDPAPRVGTSNGQGCFLDITRAYYTSFKCETACGNRGPYSGEVDSNDNTGPIRKIYSSGQNITVVANTNAHPGFFRFRLCKLANSTDKVTKKCLDENLLEISSNDLDLQVDKFTINKKQYFENGTSKYVNQTINVKLPEGLSCENCVLQWEWSVRGSCNYQNGTRAPSDYCVGDRYRNCIDIKILSNSAQSNAKYTPIPANIVKKSHPQVFSFFKVKLNRINGTVVKNLNNDPLKYIGSGIGCFLDQDVLNMELKTNNVTESIYIGNYVKKCRENCMTVDKKCPDDCFCRWFA